MSAIEKERLAFEKATEVWNQAFREASLTGSYQGMPAAQYLLSVAQITGQMYQPGTLTPEQTATYNGVSQRIDRLQEDILKYPIGSKEYDELSEQLVGLRNELAPLQAILQGTDKAPVQTLAAQQQQFEQAMALAGLTGFLPGTLTGTGGTGGVGGAGGTGGTPGVGGTGGTMTLPYQQFLAEQLGTVNGQQTLAAQLQAAQIQNLLNQFGLQQGELTGTYNGQQTLAAQLGLGQLGVQQGQLDLARQQAAGYIGGAPTLEREQVEANQANQLLNLASQLRGPRNAFQFATVLGQTPGGLSDMLAAMAGRYNLPSYAGGGAAPQAVSLQNFVGDVGAQANGIPSFSAPTMSWQQASPPYQVNQPGSQAPSSAYNYQPSGDGGTYVYPPGITAPIQAGQITSTTPLSAAQLQQIGAQSMATQPYELPLPSQWNAAAWNDANPYLKDLTLAAYEHQGWDPDAAEAQFKASLPTTGGPTTGKFAIPGL